MQDFTHTALNLKNTNMPLVYTALSKHYFYYRMFISKYVLEQHCVPLNPFMIFDYFLLDCVDRDLVRQGNNTVVSRSDQIWVFGPVSNGVLAEILQAKEQQKPVKYFTIQKPHKIVEIDVTDVEMEDEVTEFKGKLV
jgi:hypothetical protein